MQLIYDHAREARATLLFIGDDKSISVPPFRIHPPQNGHSSQSFSDSGSSGIATIGDYPLIYNALIVDVCTCTTHADATDTSAGCLTVLAASVAASDVSAIVSEPHSRPQPYVMDMAWYDAWLAEQPVRGGGHSRRSLTGSGSSSCNIRMVGTGLPAGISSVRISCTSSDRNRWRNGRVQVGITPQTFFHLRSFLKQTASKPLV